MYHLKYILILICIQNIAFAQTVELDKAIVEMKRVYEETYDIESGIQTCETVLSLSPSNTKTYFEALSYLGEWYLEKRDKVGIETLLSKMKTDLEVNQNKDFEIFEIHWYYLKSRYNYEIMYNYEKAIIFGIFAFKKAVNRPKILQNISLHTARLMGELAQYDAANKVIQVYILSENKRNKNDLEKCKFYLNVGKTYIISENYDEAKIALQKAIDFIEPIKSQSPELYKRCLLEQAILYRDSGDDCINFLRPIVANGERSYEFIGLLGTRLSSNDYYEEALPLLQECLTKITPNFTSMNIEDNPPKGVTYKDSKLAGFVYYYKTWALRLKGLEYIEKGDREKGIALLHKSIETGNIGLETAHRMIDEMIGFEIGCLAANEMVNVIDGGIIHASISLYQVTKNEADLEALFNVMERRRSLSILQKTEKSPIPENLFPTYETFVQAIEDYELKFMLATDISLGLLNEMTSLTLKSEAFFESLKQQLPKVQLNSNDISYIKVKDLQASLDDKTVFIQYAVVRHHLYALLITKEAIQVELLRDGHNMLEHSIFEYLDIIRNPLLVQEKNREDFINRSHEYYNLLIKPFEKNMVGKTHFIVSPERELLFLPYETLLKTADKKPFHELDFLIKSYEINYRYSATLHQKIQERPAIKDYSFFGFAPVFEDGEGTGKGDRSTKAFRERRYKSMKKKRFIYLPNSKLEVEKIRDLLAPKNTLSTVLIGKEATKENLIKSITEESYQFVHIATHSMVNYNDPRLSAIACYHLEGKENLYFSSDIMSKKIQADLVVLSSCESGIGRIIDGEGIIGLNRSFISSGARNVLFSLWKVDDVYSSNLMIGFYENYLHSKDYTAALRQTKLNMLEDVVAANPRYWAAFILIGE